MSHGNHGSHASHTNHASHASHDAHASHTQHGSHGSHASHSSHSNHLQHNNTLNPICTTVGMPATWTNTGEHTTAMATWDDLIAKVNATRATWGNAAIDNPAALSGKVKADDWNTAVRAPLVEAPLDSFGTTPDTAAVGDSIASQGYNEGVTQAGSKYCTSVCSSVCTSVSHANHANHGSHDSHASHSNHANHHSHDSTLCLAYDK